MKIKPNDYDKIPSELKSLCQWVVWKLVPAKPKPKKVPYQPRHPEQCASTTDATTCATYDEAVYACEQHQFSGIGFVFTKDDPYVGVDLDKCRDLKTGALEPWAQHIVEKLNSYTEVSPSGTGVHILVRGELTIKRNRKGHVEMYNQGRYFCMTGEHVGDTPLEIFTKQEELDVLQTELFGPTKVSPSHDKPRRHSTLALDDQELLHKAMTTKNGAAFTALWNGDTSAHRSPSEADMAFCCRLAFWTGRDGDRIDRLFRQSGLMRNKWDEHHGADTYGNLTIRKACDGTTDYYCPPREGPASAKDNHQEPPACKVDEWPEPIPLQDQSLPKLPTDLFPSWMENMVNAVARHTETPKELATTLGLAALATACQRTFEVEPEPGYVEPVNIWGLSAMESGNRKTAVLTAMTAPLGDYEREQANQLIPERTQIESERKTLESRIQHLRAQAAKGNSVDSVDVIKEIAELEASLPDVPTIPQLWAQDVTPEKLGQVMADQGGVLALISDEGGIFETIAGRYNGGIPNLDLLLQSHSGSPVRIHRTSREPIDMPRPVLTMGLSPQPDVLRGLIQKPGFRGRGLLARFLYTLPSSRLGYRALESSPIPLGVKESYGQVLHTLLAIQPPQSDVKQPEQFRLRLSKAAHREWKEFSLVVEKDLRDGERFGHIQDWAGKLPGAAARVAGLLHCATHFNTQPWSIPIKLTTMENALTLMAVLAEHALRAFEVMAANPDLEKAKRILAWVQRKAVATFTQRDCHHELQGTFSRTEDLKPGLHVLEERYIIRQANVPQTGPGRRPTVYDVNPQLFREQPI